MGFKVLVIAVIVAAGALGGAWAHFDMRGDVLSPEALYRGAMSTFRTTIRKFDGRYYERGDAYYACIAGYGKTAVDRPNAERVWSCECVDKNVGTLRRADRDSVLNYVRGGSLFATEPSLGAKRFLKQCLIEPGKPPASSTGLRGTS